MQPQPPSTPSRPPPGPAELIRRDRLALRAALVGAVLVGLVYATRAGLRWTPVAAELAGMLPQPARSAVGLLASRSAYVLAGLASGIVLGFLVGGSLVWTGCSLPGLHRSRRLVQDFTWRDLRGRYAGSALGFFWSVVFPLVSLAVYMFVFRVVLKARWSDTMGGEEVTLIMLTGIVVWSAFAETLHRATTSMVENANLIQKVVFPAEVLPGFLTLSSLFNMTLGLPVVLAGAWWVGGHSENYLTVREAALAAGKDVAPALGLGWALVILPLFYVLQLFFTIGLGYLLATVNVLLRDLQQLIGVIVMVWMFTTPIFYPAELVRLAGYGVLLEVNPMYWLIDSYRAVLLYGSWPDWGMVGAFALSALIAYALGSRTIALHKRTFPDML